MNILDIKVNWMLDYGNSPRIEALVANVPKPEELAYEESNGLYFAQKEGYVNFYHYDRPGSGYGGAAFKITMMNGEEKVLKGPWSSGCYAANQYFTPSIELYYTENPQYFEQGYTFRAGYGTIALVADAIGRLLPGVVLKPYWFLGQYLCWQPVWETNPCNHGGYDVTPNGRCANCKHKVLLLTDHDIWYEVNDGYRLHKESGSSNLTPDQMRLV